MTKLDPLLVSGDVDLLATARGYEGRVARARGTWRELAFDSLGGTWALAGGVQTIDARARAAGAGRASGAHAARSE